jgi:hypothetical protein
MKVVANKIGIQVRLTETVSILREYSAPRSYLYTLYTFGAFVAGHAVDAQHFALVAPDLLFAFGDEIEMPHLIDGHPDESSILKFPFAATFTHVQPAIISHVNRSLTAGQSGFRQPDAGPHIPERIATPISDIVAIAGHPKIMAGASIVIIRAANRVGQNFSMLTIEAPTGFDDLLKGARIEVFPAVFLVR